MLSHVPEILEEHYEELQHLWSVRASSLRSASFDAKALAKLDERIAAHMQGLFAVGDPMRELVGAGLTNGDPIVVFTAAVALLRADTPDAVQQVVDRFAQARGPAIDPLRAALCCAAPPTARNDFEALSVVGDPDIEAASLEILVSRYASPSVVTRLRPLLGAEQTAVRCSAWRSIAASGAAVANDDYAAAMRDDDDAVRREAMWAAVWARVPWILAYARRHAESIDADGIDLYRVLAAIGRSEDVPRITRIANTHDLESVRFAIVGSFGHPALVPYLIEQMDAGDPATSIAAGEAFTSIMGADISSSDSARFRARRPTGETTFDDEFADVRRLPDARRARDVWSARQAQLASAERVCQGYDISKGASASQLASFGLENRWYAAARNRYYGLAGPTLLELAEYRWP